MLALDCRARKNEILQLRWSDVDLADSRLRFYETKNGEPRNVPISQFAFETLFDYHQKLSEDEKSCENYSESDYVFKSKLGTSAYIKRAWYKALKAADIQNFRFHDLRHSCASDLLASGASLMHVKEVLGHKSIDATMIYAHLAEGSVREAIERASMKFGSLKSSV